MAFRDRAVIPAKEGFMCDHWQDIPELQHPDPNQGCPVGVESVSMEGRMGCNQYWLYRVCANIFKLFAELFHPINVENDVGEVRDGSNTERTHAI